MIEINNDNPSNLDDRLKRFSNWIDAAAPNEKYVYVNNYSIQERMTDIKIGAYAWDMALKGRIYLVQRRLSNRHLPSIFEYIAIKASPIPVYRLIAKTYGAERNVQKTYHKPVKEVAQYE